MGASRTPAPRPARALLVDLDDTLFDHTRAVTEGLRALQAADPRLQAFGTDDLVRRHRELLEAVHPAVVRGEINEAAAREFRFRELYRGVGVAVPREGVGPGVRAYRAGYDAHRGPVRGAEALLRTLRPRWSVVVVTYHRRVEQVAKLRDLRLDRWIDGMITPDGAGALKPDPKPFEAALRYAGVPASAAVVLGDSWDSDVVGALAAGIRPVWLNRRSEAPPAPGVAEVPSLVPVRRVVAALEGRPPPAYRPPRP